MLEDDLYFDEDAPSKPARRTCKPAKTHEQIMADINFHPMYGYANRLARYIISQIEPDAKLDSTIIFNNTDVCHYSPNTDQVVFGYARVREAYEKGFVEYQEVGYIWEQHGYWIKQRTDKKGGFFKMDYGRKGIYELVIHEVAHWLQNRVDRYSPDHGTIFCQQIDELLTLFPYEEVSQIILN